MRGTLARRGSVGQLIALEQHDLGEALAEHACRQQARDAGAEDDGTPLITLSHYHDR
jgi:hypothetical protein